MDGRTDPLLEPLVAAKNCVEEFGSIPTSKRDFSFEGKNGNHCFIWDLMRQWQKGHPYISLILFCVFWVAYKISIMTKTAIHVAVVITCRSLLCCGCFTIANNYRTQARKTILRQCLLLLFIRKKEQRKSI